MRNVTNSTADWITTTIIPRNLMNITNNTTPLLSTTNNIGNNKSIPPTISPTFTNFSTNTSQLLVNLTNSINQTDILTNDGEEGEITISKYIIIVVCFISAIVGISGNLTIVIVRIFKQFQRGNTTAYTFLICQLAIADFIFAFTICFDIHSYLHKDIWIFGTDSCKFIKLIQSASLTTTVGFLTIMAYERFCGLSNPLQHRWSIKKTSIIVLILWTYIFLTFIPFVKSLDVQDGYCWEYKHPSEDFRKVYTLFLFITNYVVPLISITVFHTLIVHRMKKHLKAMHAQRHRGSPSIRHKKKAENVERMRKMSTTSTYSMTDDATCGDGETNCWVVIYRILREKIENIKDNNNARDGDQTSVFTRSAPTQRSNVFKRLISRTKTNEDRKLVKMLVAVTLSFALMTLPTQIYYIWYDFRDGESTVSEQIMVIVEVFGSLVYLHCCSNCIIYSAMDKKFRVDVEKTFRFFFNCKDKTKLSRTSFQRATMVSRLSRFSRHSSSTTTSSSSRPKSEDGLLKKQKQLEVIEDEDVFLFEKETVIL